MQADFYHLGTSSVERVLPRIAERVLADGGRLLIVAAEMIGARSGLGYLIWHSYQVWDMAAMYIGLVLLAFFGYLFTMALNELERIVLPWRSR